MPGWFEEQISLRKQNDTEAFEDSCLKIAGSVMGQSMSAALRSEREQATDAIGSILKYYRVKIREVPDKLESIEDVLEYLLRPYGIMTREVELSEGWRKNASGAMLTTFADSGKPVALIPVGARGYKYADPVSGKITAVTASEEKLFSKEAFAFYKAFPTRSMTMRDLYGYIFANLDRSGLAGYFGFALIAVIVGMLVPWINRMLFSDIVAMKNMSALAAIAVFLICASLSGMLFKTIQELFLHRLTQKLSISVESATMMRILTLPSSFFTQYTPGDLANRVSNMSFLVYEILNMVMTCFTTALFSFIYILQIRSFAPVLAIPAFIVAALQLITLIAALAIRSHINRTQMELAAKESGLSYSLITGIEKIKLAGAQKRAFSKWARAYAAQSKYMYDPPMFVKIFPAVITAISLTGTMIVYYLAIRTGIDIGQYYAFNAAFAIVDGAFRTLVPMIEPAAQIAPTFELLRPIIEAEPEIAEDKPVIEKLSGGIELSNITFRYSADMPPVLDDLSLKIRPGQYVAITGKTGCGKSTLMRIMLGFEKPQKGAVYYDGHDLNRIDLKSLRSKIGTVMQNGSLFMGDIYSNIVISAPQLTLDDAWEAAETAGIAEDIRRMPMNMFTIIGEGAGGISGGQKQRLMIARAIAPKPKILMFDEATSALDNITQKQVSDSLDSLKCTRIVIAHRLSTIKNCDRIIVLDEGKIVEDGSYDELMARNGFFAELVARQQVSTLSLAASEIV
ncbi:MAG: ATP-binding cassette domain-containing protein [Lachnospiraceae bacterium]|nr:ATP-binding cassette domain-containing protein [Lachnospiraceae bacterium]